MCIYIYIYREREIPLCIYIYILRVVLVEELDDDLVDLLRRLGLRDPREVDVELGDDLGLMHQICIKQITCTISISRLSLLLLS